MRSRGQHLLQLTQLFVRIAKQDTGNEKALKRHGFNVTATGRAVCTTRETLRYRIQKYALKV